MQTNEQKKLPGRQYNSIDLCKFIMSFAVVAIHTHPVINVKNVMFLNVYDVFVSLAVPFFFLASGYLLAAKMDYPYGSEQDLNRVKKQLLVILRMYLTWMLIYTPLAIYHFIFSKVSAIKAILLYIRGLIFIGEQYNAWPLWYLLSMIYSLVIIGFVFKKRNAPSKLIVISIIASIFSIGFTELVDYNGNLPTIMGIAQKLIEVSIANGRILQGLVYIPIGMLLAHKKIPKHINVFIFVVGFLLNCVVVNSFVSYYLTILTAISLFGIVEDIRLDNHSVFSKLRSMSTTIYLTHMYIWSFYYKIVYGKKTEGVDSFIITSCVALAIAAFVVIKQDKEKKERNENCPQRRAL